MATSRPASGPMPAPETATTWMRMGRDYPDRSRSAKCVPASERALEIPLRGAGGSSQSVVCSTIPAASEPMAIEDRITRVLEQAEADGELGSDLRQRIQVAVKQAFAIERTR